MKNVMDMSDEERRQWAETEQDRQTFGYDVEPLTSEQWDEWLEIQDAAIENHDN